MFVLRNRLFIAVVALFVLGGYSHQIFARCDDRPQQTVQSSELPQGQPLNHPADGCHCLCHKVFSHTVIAVQLPVFEPFLENTVIQSSDSPPLADPKGIDHPPQLA